jgi:uncharacterized membrane protein
MTDGSNNLHLETLDEDKNYVIAVHALYLASFIFGITWIAGLVLAYIKKGGAPMWAASHYRYAIRTFWIGLLYSVIGIVLIPVLIGIFVLLAATVWYIVRCIVALLKALKEEEIRNVETWLV